MLRALPQERQTFGKIAKRTGLDKIGFRVYFHLFHNYQENIFLGRGRQNRGSVGKDIAEGLPSLRMGRRASP
jgi:hypothetical protein